MNRVEDSRLITTDELAQYIGISRPTLLKYVRAGILPYVVHERGGRGYLFPWPELQHQALRVREFVARGGVPSSFVDLVNQGYDPITLQRIAPAPQASKS